MQTTIVKGKEANDLHLLHIILLFKIQHLVFCSKEAAHDKYKVKLSFD